MRIKYVLVVFPLIMGVLSCSAKPDNELVVWVQMLPEGREVLREALSDFMEENPELIVKELYYETEELRSNFQIAALGGSGPDLIGGPSDVIGPFDEMDLIAPLEEYFSEEERSRFMPQALTFRNGHLFQVADRVGNHLALVYNRDLMPEPPKTMDELLEIGPSYTSDVDGDGLIDNYALVFNFIEPFFFVPFISGYGGWVMDEDGNPTLDSEGVVNALSFLLKLREENIVPQECDLDLANSLFKTGKAAMVINGPWSWGKYGDAGINYGVTRIPFVTSTGLWPAPMVSPLGYSVNVNLKGKRKENAIKLLKFLVSDNVQVMFTEKLNTLPSSYSAQEAPTVIQNDILRQSKYALEVGKPMPIEPEMRAIWDAMRPAYQAVLNGSLTPKEAAAAMQKEAYKKIEEMYE